MPMYMFSHGHMHVLLKPVCVHAVCYNVHVLCMICDLLCTVHAEGKETAKAAEPSKVADQVQEAGKMADGEHLLTAALT